MDFLGKNSLEIAPFIISPPKDFVNLINDVVYFQLYGTMV